MATSIFGLTFIMTDDATFRAFGSALSTQLGAMLTRVTTSNDINWASIARPSTGTYAATFEVYRFDDAAQTTYPIFLKFEYGQASNGFLCRLTIAKACDGAGALTGIVFPATMIFSNTATNASPQNCYISNGDGHSLALSLFPATSQAMGGTLLIERAINTDGSVDGGSLWVSYLISSTGSWNNYFCAYTAGTYNNYNGGVFPAPIVLTSGQSLANGTITPYFPAACLAPNGKYWIPRVALGGALADCATGSVITSLLDGFTYIGLGNGGWKSDQRANAYSSLLMRWN